LYKKETSNENDKMPTNKTAQNDIVSDKTWNIVESGVKRHNLNPEPDELHIQRQGNS
jgi:hypothetical protein